MGWSSLPTLVFYAFCSAEGLKWPTAAGWTHPSCFARFEIWSDALRQPVIYCSRDFFPYPLLILWCLIAMLIVKERKL